MLRQFVCERLGGRAEGLASCAGTGLGGMLHIGAAALGLSVLLAQSAVAFSVVKYIGAACLVYLGIRLLLSSAVPMPTQARPTGPRRALLEGILVEALNVKTALFFRAFLPQFLVSGASVVVQLAVMGTVCVVLNTLVDVVAVLGATRLLRSEASGRQRARLLNKACMLPRRGEAPDPSIARRAIGLRALWHATHVER